MHAQMVIIEDDLIALKEKSGEKTRKMPLPRLWLTTLNANTRNQQICGQRNLKRQ